MRHLQTESDLTASKQKENTLTGFEDFYLKAKARICLNCRIRAEFDKQESDEAHGPWNQALRETSQSSTSHQRESKSSFSIAPICTTRHRNTLESGRGVPPRNTASQSSSVRSPGAIFVSAEEG